MGRIRKPYVLDVIDEEVCYSAGGIDQIWNGNDLGS